MLKSLAARLRTQNAESSLNVRGMLKGVLPLALLAVGITALVMMVMWRDQASYKPLFGAHENVLASDMMAVLEAEGVPYRVHPDSGQVLVPAKRVGEVRMLLAAKGVVAKLPAGLELMDAKDPLGVSQFVQDVRFRRGLEGELARSIMSLEAVKSARVHVSVARSSSFVVTGGEKSSASVVLELKPGRQLQDEQIAAIVNMVAGSAAGLDPSRVTLVDQGGRLLSARVDLSDGFELGQGNDAANHYEEATRKNAYELLAPVLGDGNFRVSVTADIDSDRVQETHERYGDAPRVTNEALREELDRDPLAIGVPGSLSNRPVAVANKAAKDGEEAASTQKNASTRQYAYDRSITQVQRARNRLRKLNVAVVLNAAAAPGGAAQWTQQQLADVERVLRGGLGIDAQRGDTLVVSTLAFPAVQTNATQWWQERETIVDFGTWLSYALLAVLAFFMIIRPLMRLAQQRLALPAPEPTPVEAHTVDTTQKLQRPETAAAGEAGAALAKPMPVGPLLEDYDLPPPGSPVDVMVDHLKVLAAKEPERVAEVVKQWVQKNG